MGRTMVRTVLGEESERRLSEALEELDGCVPVDGSDSIGID